MKKGFTVTQKNWQKIISCNQGTAWTIIRPADIYDTGNKDSISSLCNLIKTSRLFPIIGDGEYKINPVHIDDVADFIFRLLECESKKNHNKIYNLTGPEPVSFKSFCEMRSQDFGKKTLFLICQFFSVSGFPSLH